MSSDSFEDERGVGKTVPVYGTPPVGHRPPETLEDPASPKQPAATDSGLDTGFDTPFDDRQAAPLGSQKVLFNKYRLIKKLDQGGMGTVLQVEHIGLGKLRALKVINADLVDDPTLCARFEREAKILARLEHPNAVSVFDHGIFGNTAYIEMEFLEGQTLRHKWVKAGKPVPLDKIDWLLGELCDVLEESHRQGIIHRDIKPENIMIYTDPRTSRERMKVLDFGIAKILEDFRADHGASSFHTAGPLGTFMYSSPEQLNVDTESKEGAEVDHRSDIYSIGVMLYEMLVGARPFSGTPTKLLLDHAQTPPPTFAEKAPAAHVPPAIEEVVRQCLNKKPDERPQSAAQLFQMFHKAASEFLPTDHGLETAQRSFQLLPATRIGQSTTTIVIPNVRAAVRTALSRLRQHRRRVLAGLFGISLCVVLFGWGVRQWNRPRAPETPPQSKPPDKPLDPWRLASLKSRGFGPHERADSTESGWPSKIRSTSGTPRTLVLHGRLYLPERYRPEPQPGSPSSLPLVLVRDDGVRFCLIEGSSDFKMGAWKDGEPFLDEEKPGHLEPLSSYYIQETEVTNGEFERFLLETNRTINDPQLADFRDVKNDLLQNKMLENEWKNYPVVGIPRNLAETYAHGVEGELPSEAQFEFAARSRGQERLYVWGNDEKGLQLQDRKANVNSFSGTVPARLKTGDCTEQGVLHLMGNVREWCRDVWHVYRRSSQGLDHVEQPDEGETNPLYVIRGASYETPIPAVMARLTCAEVKAHTCTGPRIRTLSLTWGSGSFSTWWLRLTHLQARHESTLRLPGSLTDEGWAWDKAAIHRDLLVARTRFCNDHGARSTRPEIVAAVAWSTGVGHARRDRAV